MKKPEVVLNWYQDLVEKAKGGELNYQAYLDAEGVHDCAILEIETPLRLLAEDLRGKYYWDEELYYSPSFILIYKPLFGEIGDDDDNYPGVKESGDFEFACSFLSDGSIGHGLMIDSQACPHLFEEVCELAKAALATTN